MSARVLLLLATVLLVAAPARAEEVVPEELVYVEVEVEPIAAYVGEPIRVTLRVGYDEAHFAKNAVALFRQPMDVPLQVRAPWATLRDGVEVLPARVLAGPQVTLAVGDEVVSARRVEDVVRGTRSYRVLELERTLRATAPGALALTSPVVRFAYATRFRDDFLGDRTALDPRMISVGGTLPAATVGAPPAAGRPADYAGAVGRFEVRAEVDREAVDVGETFRLTLRITGDGPLDGFPPPRLTGLEDFHVYGTVDEPGPEARTIRYDLAAVRPGEGVPPIRFVTFVPGPPAHYEVLQTAALPLAVRGSPETDPRTPPAGSSGRAFPLGLVLAAAALLAFLFLLGRLFARGAPPAAPAPTAAADIAGPDVRAAGAAFVAAAEGGEDLGTALARLVATRLGCPVPAAIHPELAARLAAAGVEVGLAREVAETLERLTAARYGAPGESVDAARVRALAARVVASP